MKINQPIIDNVELISTLPKSSNEIALFIVSNTYYFVQQLSELKIREISNKIPLSTYLREFKEKFKKVNLEEQNFSFTFMNKDNESNFYRLKLNQFINIMNAKSPNIEESDSIDSFISLRNGLIYLEYLYLLIKTDPKVVSHYIIKIHISFMLNIIDKDNKRLLNDDEFFYLNLLELKENFEKVDYQPSSFIQELEAVLSGNLEDKISMLKIKKLFVAY